MSPRDPIEPSEIRANDPDAETQDDSESASVPTELLDLRRSIDNIDAALVYLLAERFRCTQQVGHLKAQTGLPPADLRAGRDREDPLPRELQAALSEIGLR